MRKPFIAREAGATFSKKNRGIITQALALLRTALRDAGIDDGAEDDNEKSATSKESANDRRLTISTIEAAGFSFADVMTVLDTAVRGMYPESTPYERTPQIADVFDDYLVYREGWRGAFYRVDYTIDESGAVTLGAPAMVVRRVQYVSPGDGLPVSEAAAIDIETDVIDLSEAAVKPDGTARIKIIAPGIGSSGYYPADVLRRDGPRVFKAGTHMFWDHDTAAEESARPEGSLSRLAAVLKSDAVYEESGKRGAGLYADVEIRSAFRTDVDELAPYIGTSIRASGKARIGDVNGRRMPIIEEITEAKSVDFVTKPGAGGAVLSLFESAKRKHTDTDTPAIEGGSEMPLSETDRNEIAKMIADGIAAGLREATAPLNNQIAAMRDASDLREAHAAVARYLGTIDGLPAVARDRIASDVARNFTRTESGAIDIAKLTEAARQRVIEEMRYLRESGARVMIPSGFGESTPLNEAERTNGAADDGFEAEMTEIFSGFGLSENAAKIAARGRQ